MNENLHKIGCGLMKKAPNFYIAHEFDDFKKLVEKQNLEHRRIEKGTILTNKNSINNTAYYIVSGVMRFSLIREDGKEQTISLFGPGEIFSIGVVKHNHKMDYEMVLTAFSDLEVYQCDYLQLRKLAGDNPDLVLRLLQSDCDFVSYLLYLSTSLAFNSCIMRVCDVLYLSIPTEIRNKEESASVEINQELLRTFVGASRPEVERALRSLRQEKIIETGRNHIFISSIKKLRDMCSSNL